MSVVVDTNVLVVANGAHPPASQECMLDCIDALERARAGVVLVDDAGRILGEYSQHASHAGRPGVGDRFFKWLWQRQAMPAHCVQVPITEDAELGFQEFPNDPALAGFDRSDRKFVAVALASQLGPPVLNASDTDWWLFDAALRSHGLQVTHLCPQLMVPSAAAKKASERRRPPRRRRRQHQEVARLRRSAPWE
ncbi:MAG: hypothetical protein Fur0019_13790 [Tibeticola sp.]